MNLFRNLMHCSQLPFFSSITVLWLLRFVSHHPHRFVDAAAAEQLPKPRLNVNPPLAGDNRRPVGLLGAMPQEIANLRAHVQNQVRAVGGLRMRATTPTTNTS